MERIRKAVAAENDYYNGEQRAARIGPLRVPISWTAVSGPMQNGQTDIQGRPIIVPGIHIHIEGGTIGAAAQPQSPPQTLVAGPPFAQPAAYGVAPQSFAGHYAQPPSAQTPYAHPTYASTYAQPAQAPSYAQEGQAPPAYSLRAEINPLSVGGEFAQQLQPGQSPAAADAWTETPEGQPSKGHAVTSPPLPQQSLPSGAAGAGSCERCGHAAHTPADRFCAACGGSIARGT